MGTLSPAARHATLVTLLTATSWVAVPSHCLPSHCLPSHCLPSQCLATLVSLAHADRGPTRARRAEPPSPGELRTRTPVEPAPVTPPRPQSRAVDARGRPPRSAFAPAPGGASLAVLARRPAGVLIGDHALNLDGSTWSSASLTSTAVTTFPAPLRVVPSGTVGARFGNAWPAGDVLVAHDGQRTLLVRADGTFALGETRPHAPTILGAAPVGSRLAVWWRLDATRTELEVLDRATARTLARHPGPAWSWSARMAVDDERVALASDASIEVVPIVLPSLTPTHSLQSRLAPSHPFAIGRGALVVGSPTGTLAFGPGRADAGPLRYSAAGPPSILAADDTTVFALHGEDLVAADLVTRGARWMVHVAPLRSLHLVPERSATHLVLCDADGGAIVLDAVTGVALLRVGVGGCDQARRLSDGTVAIAGGRETWIVGPAPRASSAPARRVDGTVTLDGAPAAGLPVLIGAASYPLDGADGCPPVPAYARCVLTDAAGRFHASIRAHGLLSITVDADAAAHRAARPRAVGGSIEVDLDAAEPRDLRLDLTGADEEL